MRVLLISNRKKVKLTIEELERLLNNAYEDGYNDCSNEKKKQKIKIKMGF